MNNGELEIVSAFRIFPEICSSSTGTYFKTQPKFINPFFLNQFDLGINNIPGAVEIRYTRYRSQLWRCII